MQLLRRWESVISKMGGVQPCGEDRGEVALGDKEREVKEATQALRTSGHTFSREQLDKSNQVREEEEVMSSK